MVLCNYPTFKLIHESCTTQKHQKEREIHELTELLTFKKEHERSIKNKEKTENLTPQNNMENSNVNQNPTIIPGSSLHTLTCDAKNEYPVEEYTVDEKRKLKNLLERKPNLRSQLNLDSKTIEEKILILNQEYEVADERYKTLYDTNLLCPPNPEILQLIEEEEVKEEKRRMRQDIQWMSRYDDYKEKEIMMEKDYRERRDEKELCLAQTED